MPYRRKKIVRRKPKRRYRKYPLRKRTYRRTTVPSTLVPKEKLVRFVYSDRATLDLETAGAGVRAFRWSCNSIYDPSKNVSGTRNAQPRMFDQAALLYNYYLVVGSKITVKFSQTKSNSEAFFIGICKNNDSVWPRTDLCDYEELPNSVVKYCNENITSSVPTLRMGYSTKKDQHVNHVKDNKHRLSGEFNSDPTDQFYFDVFGGSADMSGQNGPILTCNVLVEYIALLYDAKEVADS